MAIRIVPLEPAHEVENFDCGTHELNVFLQTTAGQHQRKFISKSYVLINVGVPLYRNNDTGHLGSGGSRVYYAAYRQRRGDELQRIFAEN